MSRGWRGPLVAAIVAVIVGLGAAHAQPGGSEAEREFRLGYQALQARDCQTALVHYRRSLELSARPRTLFNIATCQEELGQDAAAIDSYRAFLARAESRDAALVVKARARLEALRGQLRGRLSIESDPPGAAVQIDGERTPRGVTPVILTLEPGAHVVRLTTAEAVAVERTVEVTPAGLIALRVELPQPAAIEIQVEPPDALIELDRSGAPARGRLEVVVRPGRHVVTVRRVGYHAEQIEIDAIAGRTHTQRVRLRTAAAPASLVIAGLAGATVTVDGVAVGTTPLDAGQLALGAIDAGSREVRVERAGHAPWRASLALAPGEAVTIDLRLPRATPRTSLRWGLGGLGVAGLAAGGVVGVLALRDVGSPMPADHDRGKTRALVADGLFILGTAAVITAWRLTRPPPLSATIRRAHGARP